MILFVSYGGGHISIVKILFEFFNQNELPSQILPLSTAIPYLKNRNIENFLKLEDLCSYEGSIIEQHSFIETLVESAHDSNSGIPFSFTRAYYSIGFHDMIVELGSSKKALKKYRAMGRFSFCPKLFARKVLLRLKPNAVFVTNLPRFESAFVEAANDLKIVTFGIDDLFGTRKTFPNVSTMFVDNLIAYRNYKLNGFKGKIVLSGNPVFESLYKRQQAYKFPTNTLLILLQPIFYKENSVSNYIRDIDFYKNLWFELSLKGFWKQFEQVIVRLHPSMNNGESYIDSFMSLDRNVDLHDSINSVSHVLGFSSTSLYEAFLSGKKYLGLKVDGISSYLPIKYSGDVSNTGHLIRFRNKFNQGNEFKTLKSKELILRYVRNELLCNRK